MATLSPDPATHRRKLRSELRAARERAQFTQQNAAEKLDWSVSKLLRIESGAVGVSVTDLRALLELYRVTDPAVVEDLIESARSSKGRPWWHEYRDFVKPQFAQYLGYEAAAADLKVFHPTLLPGLVQTEESATEILKVLTSTSDGSKASTITAQVTLRTERQERLSERQDVRELAVIFDESALRRSIGSAAVMQRQLRRLKKLVAQPKVWLGMIPFSAGIHPALGGPFVVLQFAGGEDDVLYVEGPSGDLLIRDDQEAVAERLTAFETLREIAVTGDALVAVLDEAIAALEVAAGSGPDAERAVEGRGKGKAT